MSKKMTKEQFDERNDMLKMILLTEKLIELSNKHKSNASINRIYTNTVTTSTLLKERLAELMDEDGYNASNNINLDEEYDDMEFYFAENDEEELL